MVIHRISSLRRDEGINHLLFFNIMKLLLVSIFLLMLPNVIFGQQRQISNDENVFPWHQLKLGQSEISISGSYRMRGELQDGFNIKTFGTVKREDYLLSRLRMNTEIRFFPQMRFNIQLQDAEVFSSSLSDRDFSTGNNPFHDPLDINQAYVEILPFKAVKFKIGRQSISFRDRRIFGPGDWGNTGRYAWDAALLTLTNRYLESNWIVGRFILHNPDHWPNRWAGGPTAYACYNTIKPLPFLLDIFYVFKHDDRSITQGEKYAGILSSHSFGLWLSGNHGPWQYGSTAVGQVGQWGSDQIQAYGVVSSLGYQLNTSWNPLFKVQYITGSGDTNPTDGIHGTFDGVFGGSDTDLYGWMNLFFWQNLREYRADIKLAPNKRITLIGEYHYFTLDKPKDAWYFPGKALRRDKNGNSGLELGHEIDLTARIKVLKYLEILVGSCFFIPGEYVKNTGKSPLARWYFCETTLYF